MGPTRTTAERFAELFQPAFPAEGAAQWILGEALLRELAADDPRRDAVHWRTLELRVRYDPLGAAARLLDAHDGEPIDADRLRAEVALATGDVATAAQRLAPYRGQGAAPWHVTRAHLAVAQGRLDDARASATAALEAPGLDDEWRALALAWRAEVAQRAGDEPTLTADRAALRALLEVRAPGSSAAIALHLAIAAAPQREVLHARIWDARVDQVIDALCDGIAADRLGPIPHHVHAAFIRHRGAPLAVEGAVLAVAGLLHRAARLDEAYATFHYGAALAHRLLPERAARFDDALAAYESMIGAAAVEARRAVLEANAAAHLRVVQPPAGSA